MSVAQKLLTIEDFDAIPEASKKYELEYGVLVEVPNVGNEQSSLGALIGYHLLAFLGAENRRCVFDGTARFRLARDPDLIRGPDVSYVPPDRLPPPPWPDGAMDVVPAFVVEIVSRFNTAVEIDRKIEEYFTAGVGLVWVIYPDTRRVYVYDSPTSCSIRHERGTIDGGKVLPGFRLQVEDLLG